VQKPRVDYKSHSKT